MATGYVWHPLYGWFDPGNGSLLPADISSRLQPLPQHPAHPDTKRRLHELITVSGTLDTLSPVQAQAATVTDLERVHAPEHVARMQLESEQVTGGQAGDGTSLFGKGSFEIAALAAGGVIPKADRPVSRRNVDWAAWNDYLADSEATSVTDGLS